MSSKRFELVVFFLFASVNIFCFSATVKLWEVCTGKDFLSELSNFQYGVWRGVTTMMCTLPAFFFAGSIAKCSLGFWQKVSIVFSLFFVFVYIYFYSVYDFVELAQQGAALQNRN